MRLGLCLDVAIRTYFSVVGALQNLSSEPAENMVLKNKSTNASVAPPEEVASKEIPSKDIAANVASKTLPETDATQQTSGTSTTPEADTRELKVPATPRVAEEPEEPKATEHEAGEPTMKDTIEATKADETVIEADKVSAGADKSDQANAEESAKVVDSANAETSANTATVAASTTDEDSSHTAQVANTSDSKVEDEGEANTAPNATGDTVGASPAKRKASDETAGAAGKDISPDKKPSNDEEETAAEDAADTA
jgi:hypothetical protein